MQAAQHLHTSCSALRCRVQDRLYSSVNQEALRCQRLARLTKYVPTLRESWRAAHTIHQQRVHNIMLQLSAAFVLRAVILTNA
jgi:hypothetical protein